ncbi:alpha/beta hydrolase [Phenylobacterium soli]|uniref:Alpha/beta hydrolase n=1 Tax=Phenylobacterium soli TaxID=2170551 RepID=A0A328AGD6_9CAUL|nr:alpha/beta hydrolase [Phenylobacterium soli]RAK53176.1 alpha/beta hydrolase [Phenylobacterium soli]
MADEARIETEAPREAYDDRPTHLEPGELPPEVQAPLAIYKGAEPPTPKWFKDAVAIEPERGFVESLGSKLEVLSWGEVGKPGLLLVHGNSAHADWWSFIAPYFADDYRVTSMSLAGMGASDWREKYAFGDFADDAEAVAQATGLYAGGRKPIYIGHSFGGGQVFYAASRFPERMHAAILVDTGFGGPPPEELERRKRQAEMVRNIPTVDRPSRVYPTLEAALARFRLMPPQPAGNPFIADFIARRSLKRAPLPDGSGEGWTWRFDPEMWNKLTRSGMEFSNGGAGKVKVEVPLAHIYGANSRIIEHRKAGAPSPLPDDVLEIEIPDSHHHVMIDQPLALVAALRALLAAWPH